MEDRDCKAYKASCFMSDLILNLTFLVEFIFLLKAGIRR